MELCLSGKPTGEVAQELGIRANLLSRWKREHKQRKEGGFSGHVRPSLSPEQAEVARLKKQLREAEIERDILKKAVSIFSKSERATGAANIRVHEKAPIYVCRARHPVGKMCKAFKVSRSGYYQWFNRKPSARQVDKQSILQLIREMHKESKGRYGSPKITRELHKRRIQVSRPRVAKLMKVAGIRSVVHRKFKIKTTGRRSLILIITTQSPKTC